MFQRANPDGELVIPADTWNKLLDQLERALSGGPPLGRGPAQLPGTTPPLVMVRNDSGAKVPRWGVLALRDEVITPAASEATWGENLLMSGDVPGGVGGSGVSGSGLSGSGPVDEAVALMIEPVAPGSMGLGVTVGMAWARVDVTDAAHRFAAPAETTDHLVSTGQSAGACARILKAEGGTGVKRARVLMPAAGGCLGGTVRVRIPTGICKSLSGS